MLDKPPPSRYRVLEQGKRLIVVDSATGQPVGTAAEIQGGRSAGTVTTTPLPSDIMQVLSEDGGTLPAAAVSRQRETQDFPVQTNDKAGRIMMLVVGGVFGTVFLFWSGLWIVAAFVIAVPPLRSIAWSAAKTAVSRFVKGAN
jgi:hypothetical protein